MERRKKNPKRARASTADVLGIQSQAPRITPKWREYYNALVTLRSRLVERKGVLVRDASQEQPAYSLHMADAGTDTYDRDFALSIASSEQDELYQIDQALNRIREGSYGICESTGKPIEAERLKAIPWARFSAAAEKELERNGVVKRAKLGELVNLPMGSEPDREEEEAEAE